MFLGFFNLNIKNTPRRWRDVDKIRRMMSMMIIVIKDGVLLSIVDPFLFDYTEKKNENDVIANKLSNSINSQ